MMNSISNNSYVRQIESYKNMKTQKPDEQKIQEYKEKLSQKFGCLTNGYCAVSDKIIREAALNPEKAHELEENLNVLNNYSKNVKEINRSQGMEYVDGGCTIDANGEIHIWEHTRRTSSTSSENNNKNILCKYKFKNNLSRDMNSIIEKRLQEKKKKEKYEAKKLEEKREELLRQKRIEEFNLNNKIIMKKAIKSYKNNRSI